MILLPENILYAVEIDFLAVVETEILLWIFDFAVAVVAHRTVRHGSGWQRMGIRTVKQPLYTNFCSLPYRCSACCDVNMVV